MFAESGWIEIPEPFTLEKSINNVRTALKGRIKRDNATQDLLLAFLEACEKRALDYKDFKIVLEDLGPTLSVGGTSNRLVRQAVAWHLDGESEVSFSDAAGAMKSVARLRRDWELVQPAYVVSVPITVPYEERITEDGASVVSSVEEAQERKAEADQRLAEAAALLEELGIDEEDDGKPRSKKKRK